LPKQAETRTARAWLSAVCGAEKERARVGAQGGTAPASEAGKSGRSGRASGPANNQQESPSPAVTLRTAGLRDAN